MSAATDPRPGEPPFRTFLALRPEVGATANSEAVPSVEELERLRSELLRVQSGLTDRVAKVAVDRNTLASWPTSSPSAKSKGKERELLQPPANAANAPLKAIARAASGTSAPPCSEPSLTYQVGSETSDGDSPFPTKRRNRYARPREVDCRLTRQRWLAAEEETRRRHSVRFGVLGVGEPVERRRRALEDPQDRFADASRSRRLEAADPAQRLGLEHVAGGRIDAGPDQPQAQAVRFCASAEGAQDRRRPR